MRATDELLHTIATCTQIPSVKRRLDIERELRTHVDDFIDAARSAGHEEHQIEALLRTHFGDPQRLAEQFAWVYRHERRTLLIVSGTASIMLMSVGVIALTLVVQAACASSLGSPLLSLLASRHTFIEATDILACVSVYMVAAWLEPVFKHHRFHKAALLITAVVAPLIIAGSVLGLHLAFLVYGTITALFVRASCLLLPHTTLRIFVVLGCFALAGLGFARLRPTASPAETVATCISWLAVGAGYLVMPYAARRLDAGLLNALQRL